MSEAIRTAIKTLYRTTDIVEIRALDKFGIRRVGRYPVGWDLVRALAKEDELGRDCYFVLNPTSLPPLPIGVEQGGTKETDVPRRRWFLLDFDPVRGKEEKLATDRQHDSALRAARSARDFLHEEGWDGIVFADSGNGGHLLTPIDLPNTPEIRESIRRAQRATAERYSTEHVACECFPDAARLVRAYGTLNKKGDETETLKYRRSQILDRL